MQKAKEYDWKDSNMALFGSDTDKKVKKESAETEKAWKETKDLEGNKTVIFRIVKFKVTSWPKEDYGEFYNGDSYIIYHQELVNDILKKDVHFWIGKHSSQDEYGTAAYKTVELDTFHDDEPIQHREVQGHESDKFKTYFDSMTLLKGGADTGFRRVTPEAYKPRLFHVQKQPNRKITSTEISLKKGNLKSEDVFIFDLGQKIYQYNGSSCSHDEKFKAAAEVAAIKSKRGGKVANETLEEDSTSSDHPIFASLKEGTSKDQADVLEDGFEASMMKISDADGSLDMEEKQAISRSKLDEMKDDVVILDFGDHVFCWVGSGASIDERRNGLSYASNYLNKTEHPWAPITVIAEGQESEEFSKRL